LNEVWQSEKANVAGTQHIKEEIDKVKLQMEEARRKGDWQKMSELQYGKLPQLEAQLKKADDKEGREGRCEEAEAPAHAGRRRGDRRGRVARDRHTRVEDDAGRAREAPADGGRAASARRRPGRGGAPRLRRDPPLTLGLADPNRPYGSFLFLGPTAWARPSSARRSPSSCSIRSST
jgi:ATP-dependent Clp protease ATP-binding subunit ClpB